MSISKVEPTPVLNITAKFSQFPTLNQLEKEDLLDLQMIPLEKPEGDLAVNNAQSYLKINNQPIDMVVNNLPIVELVELFNEVNRLRKNPLVRYLTGIQIYFGSQDNKLFLIYQPVYMEWVDYDGAGQNDLYKVIGRCGMYSFNTENNQFVLDTTNQSEIWISNYKQLIRIKHNDITGTVHEKFIPYHDTESLIFPFQTIFTLLHDNDGEIVEIRNSIAKVNYDVTNKVKHRVLLYVEPSVGVEAFDQKYANRSHLCPPCNGVNLGYNLAPLP